MPLLYLHPTIVEPLHEPRMDGVLDELVEDMRENGWCGRPLLVIKHPSGYQAWTGSHRIAAARQIGLQAIPCYVISEKRITRHGVDATYGHVEDWERLEVIRKVGDETATQIMWEEGRC